MLLEGIFLPLTTPFSSDGRLSEHKLASNVEHYSRTPAAGMLVLGDVGERDSLTDDETRAVLSTVIHAAAREKVMLASVGRESVHATLALAEFAAKAGYDAIAIRGPWFTNEASMHTEVMTYFRAVADGVALPVILESSRRRHLSAEMAAEFAEHPQVIGLVEDALHADRALELKTLTAGVSRDVTVTTVFAAATRRMLALAPAASGSSLGGVAVLAERSAVKTRTKTVGFQILSGSTKGMLQAWQAGASGAVPRLGPAAPQACCEVWQAFKDGDAALAEEKQHRVEGSLADRMDRSIGGVKYGCDFNGYYGGRPRLPILGLTAAERTEVEQELAGMRN